MLAVANTTRYRKKVSSIVIENKFGFGEVLTGFVCVCLVYHDDILQADVTTCARIRHIAQLTRHAAASREEEAITLL